jgi:hypothetical protein
LVPQDKANAIMDRLLAKMRKQGLKVVDGTCKGYEGFLTDNYYALLAVLDREAALARGGAPSFSRKDSKAWTSN